MKAMKNQEAGVTLVEVMLALVIASVIIIMGIQQFAMYKTDMDVRELRANIDMLAQAAANYYYQECYGQQDQTTGVLTPGVLNPDKYAPNQDNIVGMTIPMALLKTKGMMPRSVPYNPIAANPSSPESSYLVQFKRFNSQKKVCLTSACSGSNAVQVATIVGWQIQIGVKLNDTTKAEVYKNLTGANCLTSMKNATTLKTCAEAGVGDKEYLMFERSPSQPIPGEPAIMWQNNPIMLQNVLFYRQLPLSYLLSTSSSAAYRYILCTS